MKLNTLARIVLVACLGLAIALLLGSGARAVPLSPDLNAGITMQIDDETVPVTTNSVAHGTTLEGNLAWDFDMSNQSSSAVPTPTISVTSGYDPSLLFADDAPITSFPFGLSQPSLPSNSGFDLHIGSSFPASMQVGCDTARSVTPLLVPPGGAQQTITVTIRCLDPNVNEVQGGLDLFRPCGDPTCNFTFVSFLPPQNLDQGERAAGNWTDSAPAHFSLDLGNLVTGKQYAFTLVVQTPNPFGVAIAQTPNVGLIEHLLPQPSSCCNLPTTSLTTPVPSLDGPILNAGAVTFSTAEPHIWNLSIENQRKIVYNGTEGGVLDYAGPPSAPAGQPVTLSADWDPEGVTALNGTPITFTLGSQSCTAATSNGQASCTMTLSQPVGSYTLQIFSAGDVSVHPTSAAAPFSITGPTTTDQCKHDGWEVFGIFKNQGDCVSYVATKGKNPPG